MVRTTALLLGLIAAAGAYALQTSPQGLKGRVRDPEGRAIAGAELWVRPVHWKTEWARPNAHKEGPAAVSGPDGGFEIPGLPLQGRDGLVVCRKGYIQRWTTATEDVVLTPGTPLSGRVTGRRGKPVAGAHIGASFSGEGRGCLSPPPSPCPSHEFTRTDEQGRFHLDLEKPGWYNVSVQSDRYLSSVLELVRVLPGQGLAGLEIALDEGVIVKGRVFNPEGKPIQGAKMHLSGGRSASFEVESRGNGGYRFPAVEPGKRRLSVQHPGFSPEWREIQVPSSGMKLDIVLHPPQRSFIRGRVLGPDGRSVAGAVVGSVHDTLATTLADGSFELEVDMEMWDLEDLDNRHWLWARKAGYGLGASEVLEPPPVEGVEIYLPEGITLTGRLLGLDPEELADANVNVYWPDGFSPEGESGVDSDGRYRVQDLAPGTWTISANAGGQHLERTLTLEPGPVEVVFDLAFDPTSEVSGWVTGLEGEPIRDEWVQFNHSDGSRLSAETRDDGSYSIRLKDGTWTAIASAGKDRISEQKTVLVAGSPVDGVDFQLERGVVLTGRLLGLLPGEKPHVHAHTQGLLRFGDADQEGNYRITGLGPGEWTVAAKLQKLSGIERIGQAVLHIPPEASEATLDLDFSLGDLTLSGRVIGRGENTAVWARLLLPDGPEVVVNPYRLEEKGFRFDRLRAGSYRLQLTGRDGQVLAEQAVELAADTEIVVEVSPP